MSCLAQLQNLRDLLPIAHVVRHNHQNRGQGPREGRFFTSGRSKQNDRQQASTRE